MLPDALKARIIAAITAGDLDTLSVRQIRRALEAEDGRSYAGDKAAIAAFVRQYLAEMTGVGTGSASEREDAAPSPVPKKTGSMSPGGTNPPPPAVITSPAVKSSPPSSPASSAPARSDADTKPAPRGGNAFTAPLTLSAPLAALLGVASLPRPQVVKQLWAYIKANNLQHASDKRIIVCDARLRAVFGTETVSAFGMNKELSKHMWRAGDTVVDGRRVVPEKPASAVKAKAKKPKKKRKQSDAARANNPLNAQLAVLPPLAGIIGSERESRPQVVKKIWAYIKAHALQDPADKRFILCNEPLRKVLGAERVSMFAMNKAIGRFLVKDASGVTAAGSDFDGASSVKDEDEDEDDKDEIDLSADDDDDEDEDDAMADFD